MNTTGVVIVAGMDQDSKCKEQDQGQDNEIRDGIEFIFGRN